jgi:YkoY family integral membrane protein
MEGLLSADNALVLAVMVKHLPHKQRKKALFYGLLGAYFFRFLAIGIGVYLIQIKWVKMLGAAYLAWLAYDHFFRKHKSEGEEMEISKKGILMRLFGPFWGTVISVELMDIAFSVDSILAAFGVSQQVWILFIGGILGVLMMRGVAGVFLRLIMKIPELESAAFILIAVISIKMFLSIYEIHIGHGLFFAILAVIFGYAIGLHYYRKKHQHETANM